MKKFPHPPNPVQDLGDFKVVPVRAKTKRGKPRKDGSITFKVIRRADPSLDEAQGIRRGHNALLKEVSDTALQQLRKHSYTKLKFPNKANILVRVKGIHKAVLQQIIDDNADELV